ncbi:isocitrate lyase/PEP mutase family protein [Aneurinibacillus sp. Ricciae_BoGa-3]|uniref:isocitrate lyase/PEP mutase family protein n=1 Tax=Aneurinibacillus sp. Ricciae_BoGa-3 TaxID=3022697 RepID=UPI002340D765|nr:isocitrate lyase/PEP mutase family protein [Aneurinibacillus sp. Ricciae_BoGa-3]WCK56245.1 isocitrate lyase/PEP mutase family protein [Aneurinibacillus sp. Ricciae_BoGa-3]
MDNRVSFKKLFQKEGIIVAPGCHDALGARIIEHVGFEVLYMTGNGVSASLLGKPDIGLVTMSEMVTRARGIVSSVKLPVICDADTGYGNINNVIRTVQEFEAAGVTAIHIEDQITPKKCGAMDGLQYISMEEHVSKIKAAVKARKDKNFLIIARTDSRVSLGLEEAIRRGKACAEAGADIIYIEMLESVEELREVARKIDAPLMYDMLENTRVPYMNIKNIENIGYKLVIFPLSSTFLYAKTTLELMASLKATGTTSDFLDRMMTIHDYEMLLGLDKRIGE